MQKRFLIMALAVLAGCRPAADANLANEAAPEPVRNGAPPIASPAPGTPGGLPDDRTPLIEPRGPIDPKSAEAAGQVMQQYAALLEQRRFAEAYRLWGDGGRSSGLSEQKFAAQFPDYAEIHFEIGKPDDLEGAAGSIYTTVRFRMYGRWKNGADLSLPGTATLRRVNDVPGSSAEQRRWHIEHVDFDGAA
jgi:hypothetical protein